METGPAAARARMHAITVGSRTGHRSAAVKIRYRDLGTNGLVCTIGRGKHRHVGADPGVELGGISVTALEGEAAVAGAVD